MLEKRKIESERSRNWKDKTHRHGEITFFLTFLWRLRQSSGVIAEFILIKELDQVDKTTTP